MPRSTRDCARASRPVVADDARAGVRLQQFEIAGPAGPLEVVLQERHDQTPAITAVVCHPHPLYGGTLHNKVVHRAAAAFLELGAAVIRFNFRGVGKSAGAHDRGTGELEDARAAWRWMEERHPDARRWIAGFSFGAWVGARLAAGEPACERMILIAPPVGSQDFSVLTSCPVPKLVIQGTADDMCPPVRLREQFPAWAEPKQVIWVPDASHFFDRQLGALTQALHEGLDGVAAGAR
jgi:alpha/beta superfamily hydrolase